jgi:hypothetical protein
MHDRCIRNEHIQCAEAESISLIWADKFAGLSGDISTQTEVQSEKITKTLTFALVRCFFSTQKALLSMRH